MKFPEIDEAKKFYPHGYYRTDKLGRPVYIERIGHLKFDSLVKVIPLEKLQLYFIQSYERLVHEIFPACSRTAGKRVDQTMYIIDLKGAGMKIFSSKLREIIKLASSIGQDYYPEILGTMFIINAPLFFSGVWTILKHFIDEKTKKKIHILDSKYQKELYQFANVDNLPDFLGGKMTSQDYGEDFCKEQGPWKEEMKQLQLIQPIRYENVVEKPQNSVDLREIQKESTNEGPNNGYASINQNEYEKEIVIEQNGEMDIEAQESKRRRTLINSIDWDNLEVAQERTRRNSIKDFNLVLSFERHRQNTKR